MTRIFLSFGLISLLAACEAGIVPVDDGSDDNVEQPADTGSTEPVPGADTATEPTDTASTEPAPDLDQDGYGNDVDCNDSPADSNADGIVDGFFIHPDAEETCDGIDQDCDGSIDEDLALVDVYVDNDGDGYGAGDATQTCEGADGYAAVAGDCNDSDASFHPGAEDIAGDGLDTDCDDETQPTETETSDPEIEDTAGDDSDSGTDDSGTSDSGSTEDPATDADADGYTDASDCDDSDSSINPGATETCDGIDQDCDGSVDEGVTTRVYEDDDADGWGDELSGEDVCSVEDGFTTVIGDCDDTSASVYPGATESADGVDDDCDGSIDEGTTPETDADSDGYASDEDCDDNDAAINPAASEYSAGLDDEDNDCDGSVDEDWQAAVEVTYPSSGYYQLNAAIYTSGASLPAWTQSDTESSGTNMSVEFLTSDGYDATTACGVVLNVSENNPASDWLCVEWDINDAVAMDVWLGGNWYDESDAETWIADNGSGSCAVVIQTNSSSSCTPIDDT